MSRVLSQAEIDALLTVAIGTRGAAPRAAQAGPVVRYNVRRPDRVSKEQMHALQFLHERAARNLSTSLSAYLRTTIALSVASVEQFAYQEFLSSLADPTAYYSVSITPFDELGALEISPTVAFAMIDRMLGGTGQTAPMARPLTEIEQNVIDEVVMLLLDGLADGWRAVASLSFGIRGRETRPQMLQVAAPNEIVCAVAFDLKVGDVRGTVNLCIPTNVVETAEGQFSNAWQRQKRELTATERSWLTENLGRVPLPVVPLIRTRLKTGAVLALKPGEVVGLPLSADSPIDIYVGGVRKMTGRLAAERGRLMVQIEQRDDPAAAGVM
ncbi:MAG: flagellar motor switch protein FliM [Acidobacteria bacterium]|nr:flagellar motor switch protein FliM [Acidobacteriota bacterium]